MKRKPQPETPAAPVPAKDLRKQNLTADVLKSLDKAMRPTREEISGMIQSLCRRKRWTREFLARLMSIQPHRMLDFEKLRANATNTEAKIIWMFYTLDAAPELVFSPPHIATYGKVQNDLPRPHGWIEGDKRKEIIEELKRCAESKYKLSPGRLTVAKLGEKYNVSPLTASRLCATAGYRPVDGRKKWVRKRVAPGVLRADSVWLHVDWRKSVKEIAEDVKTTESHVKNVRTKFRRFTKTKLRRHLAALGIPEDRFEPIFAPPKKALEIMERWDKIRERRKNNTLLSGRDSRNNTLSTGNDETKVQQEEKSTGPQSQAGVEEVIQLHSEPLQREVSDREEELGAQNSEGG